MLESNLKAGKQSLGSDPSALEYGVSITDGCISIDETEALLRSAYDILAGS
jgi:3-deoxy-7-phosphoheptulonate synthase